MSLEKLINQILANPNKVTEADCDKLLTASGYELRRSAGSHKVYHKANSMPITIISPKSSKYVRPEYVERMTKMLKLRE
jgi:predicted RNA binding protein YcfA (HicA-like mRNA interferase family)